MASSTSYLPRMKRARADDGAPPAPEGDGRLPRRRPGGREGRRGALRDERPLRPDAEEGEAAGQVRPERGRVVEQDPGRLAVPPAGGRHRVEGIEVGRVR